MYTISEDDDLIQLIQIPAPDAQRPLPTVLLLGDQLLLAYYLDQTSGGSSAGATALSDATTVAPCALFSFTYTRIHFFGLPNDEALNAHPLSGRGLKAHSAFEVKNSSWVYQLEKMTPRYREHDQERFEALRHFIFTFHDSTFECLAEDYHLSVHNESIANIMCSLAARN
jgi:hypothetical protein